MTPKRFCPNCGSESVAPDDRHTNVLGEAIFNNNKWLCKDCNYTGLMPTGRKTEETEFEPKEQEKLDTDAGKAHFKYFLYIFLPFMAISALYFIFLA
jgi:hypothetical protein